LTTADISHTDGGGARALPGRAKKLLAPYFPELDLDRVRIKDGLPWYVVMRADAYTDRYLIYFARGKYDPDSLNGLALIAHELAHCAQYKKHGAWRFRLMYFWSWLVNLSRRASLSRAYLGNRFEVAARTVERMVYDDLSYRVK
jgi:hypothetical protein